MHTKKKEADDAAGTGRHAYRKPPNARSITEYGIKIYRLGYPQILMQLLMTVYVIILNIILSGFGDEAVTVLGLYYKVQTFFFIPLIALQTCIVPILSYNYAQRNINRCKSVITQSMVMAVLLMMAGVFCFEFIPEKMILIFSRDSRILEIGTQAFRVIGISFIPAVFSLTFPVFFQAIGEGKVSVLLSITRQIFCLIPIFMLLSLIGLQYVWIAFPLSEIITGGTGLILYIKWLRKNKPFITKDSAR